ncbi:hypothetical protein H5410_065098 [Solanum commersonii]|uniref:Uncharacterized protein n=1 Tax=Solanum commersonii TaxID=4109 RepID=A0A9J5VY46_SOLCO|nr:hypothetical protein H5410_065098 [Solanum commersonii]
MIKLRKEHAPIAHKRKNYEDFIPQQGKSKLVHTSSKKGVTTSVHVIGETLVKRKSVPTLQVLSGFGRTIVTEEHDINDLPNRKRCKRKSVIPATSLDQFKNKRYTVMKQKLITTKE